uniref:Uncharacterized protein n=1 Tax=Anguilla anguilla TaxID=7936 RepID=A0A0E9SSV9_ANGAN
MTFLPLWALTLERPELTPLGVWALK